MRSAWERALALREEHGIVGAPSDQALAAVLAAERLRVVEGRPFVGAVREVYAAGALGIRGGLAPEWRRWLRCHGLGHHLLHRGNHLYVRDGLHLWQRQEIEAELFAGTLLFGGRCRAVGVSELASRAAIPPECVTSWQAALLLMGEEMLAT